VTSRGTKYWNSGAIPLIAPEILGDIIAEVADLSIVISVEGTVLSVLVNPIHDTFRRLEHWEGRDVRSALTTESVPKFNSRLQSFLEHRKDVRPVELNHTDSLGNWEFPVRYSFHRIGPDGAILMMGRDLRPIAEMQQQLVNAQLVLERDHEAQREFESRFRVLMENGNDPVVFMSLHTGQIADVNRLAAELIGSNREDLIGQSFADLFESRKNGDLVEMLSSRAIGERGEPLRATLRRSGVDVTVVASLFRASGERLMMCIVRDAAAAASMTDALTRNLRGLYHQIPDAIVFADSQGAILSANEGFLDLIDSAHDLTVKGRDLADYLARGLIDLRVMTENAARSGRMRHYATRISGGYGEARAVEISVACLDAGPANVFAFVIRDVTRADVTRAQGSALASEDNMRSVMELVGGATLKQIVSEATDVVEKMCIETAVELTSNNRVAAAEMLGLSRQSLYVKLRKYDLLAKGGDDKP
jgi:transcriptional regulator PpsR